MEPRDREDQEERSAWHTWGRWLTLAVGTALAGVAIAYVKSSDDGNDLVISQEFRLQCGRTAHVSDCRAPTEAEWKACQDDPGEIWCPANTWGKNDPVKMIKEGTLNLCACRGK